MTGEEHAAPGRPYTLQEANDACLGRGPAAADPPRLTVEDVVLLLLHEDPRPMEGKKSRVRRTLVAAARALREYGVEPILFSGGRRGPSASHINDAVEQLAFSNKVRVSGGRQGRNFAIEITPRGRATIGEKHELLQPAARAELARIRARLGAPRPRPRPRPRPPAAKEQPAHGGDEAAKLLKYVDRGDRLLEEGRHDEAYAYYKLAAKLRAPGAGLRLRMARSMAEMGLYKDALRHCRAAIRDDPAGAGCYVAAGHCLSSLGRHAEALPYQQRAAGLDPGSTAAHQGASFSLFRLGRYEEALRHAESAASIQPKDPEAHARVASCLSRLDRHEEAASAGRKAIEAAPNRVDSYLPLITSLLGLDRHEEALEWCSRAIEADRSNPLPHSIMALSLRELGRHEEALPHCERSVELDPHNPHFHAIASNLLRDLGRLDDALPHCEAVVSADPGNLPALSNMGSMLAELDRHKEALACFDSALQIDPRQPAPRYNRALSLQAAGRPRRALEEYKRVIALDPGNAGAYNNAGTVLSGLGRDGEALAHFDRALELDPGNTTIHHNKALSLQILGQHREALAHFDRALELDPGGTDVHIGRATCLVELGLPDGEIGHYARDALGPVAAAAAAGETGHDTEERRVAAPVPRPPARRRAPAKEAAHGAGRAQQVRSLLTEDESEVLEFKSWPGSRPNGSKKPGKMEETIARELCSLANTRGGNLLVGVSDGGEVEGLSPNGGLLSRKQRGKMLEWAANVIADYFGADHGSLFDCEIVDVDGLDILHCAVAVPKDGPVILRKRLGGKHDFFVRVGSTCRPLGSEELLNHVRTEWPEWASRPRPIEQPAIGPPPDSAPRAGGLVSIASCIRALAESAMTMAGKL